MNIICAPSGIVDPTHPAQGVQDIKNAGFKNISLDIFMYCHPYILEHIGKQSKGMANSAIAELFQKPEKLENQFTALLSQCRDSSLQISAARAPYLLRDTKRRDLNVFIEELTKHCIRLCEKTGCSSLIVPPLFSGIAKGQEWQINRAYYLRLADIAYDCHVTLLLENQCSNYNGHFLRGICSDPEEAAQWVDCLNEEAKGTVFGFCLDTGVCSLCGQNMHEFALTLGNRIKAVRLRDCNGQQENSLLPFTCANQGQTQTDWLNLIRGLREICFDSSLILDFSDTAAVFSPLLRPQLLLLARSVAEYFKWQIEIENLLKKYDSIVLFGAGNMCRNYMKCYGEKYPPLFTCDNNQTLWGTSFCGLEIKSPEALKNLPDDCVVFICNIYYREIEKQLQELGVRHIEFFNDEYMPSFHFDRIERR